MAEEIEMRLHRSIRHAMRQNDEALKLLQAEGKCSRGRPKTNSENIVKKHLQQREMRMSKEAESITRHRSKYEAKREKEVH